MKRRLRRVYWAGICITVVLATLTVVMLIKVKVDDTRENLRSILHAASAWTLESTEDFERVHIARTIEQLVEQSEVIQRALAEDRLMITGARYQLDTGKVEVLSF